MSESSGAAERPEHPEHANQADRAALIIFPGALGDLICLGPTIQAIGHDHGGAGLELIARPELVRLAIGRMGIDGGSSIDRREMAELFVTDANEPSPGIKELFARYGTIHSFLASDNPTFRANLIAAAPDAVVRFYRFRPPGDSHVSDAYLAAYYASNGPAMPSPPSRNLIKLCEGDLSAAKATLAELKLEAGGYVAILPGSGSPTKNWPVAKYLDLARRLAGQIGVLFIVGPAEADIEPVLRSSGLPIIADIDLGEVAALCRMARVFVGNDSGVSHLAAATGAPGVVIFGPTDPARWRPIGDIRVLRHDPATSLGETLGIDEVGLAVEQKIGETTASAG